MGWVWKLGKTRVCSAKEKRGCPVATKQRLVPFHHWLNLTDTDTNFHGPFDFAGEKDTQPGFPSQLGHNFAPYVPVSEPLPWFDLPSYSNYVNQRGGVPICNPLHVAALYAVSALGSLANLGTVQDVGSVLLLGDNS
jgi:hypothetical protein